MKDNEICVSHVAAVLGSSGNRGLIHCCLFFKGGVSSGYKKFTADKGLSDETYTQECVALIRISGTSIHNNSAIQVDAV